MGRDKIVAKRPIRSRCLFNDLSRLYNNKRDQFKRESGGNLSTVLKMNGTQFSNKSVYVVLHSREVLVGFGFGLGRNFSNRGLFFGGLLLFCGYVGNEQSFEKTSLSCITEQMSRHLASPSGQQQRFPMMEKEISVSPHQDSLKFEASTYFIPYSVASTAYQSPPISIALSDS